MEKRCQGCLEAAEALHKIEKDALGDLTDNAIAARYDDLEWANDHATKENSAHWIGEAQNLLNKITMNRKPVNRRHALAVAGILRQRLEERGVPVQEIFVFGSASRKISPSAFEGDWNGDLGRIVEWCERE